MLLPMWSYIKGYVMIEVSGFSVERFMNLAAARGIFLWDIEYYYNKVRMKVTVQGFKKLKGCAKKTGCRVKIAGRFGAPFVVNRYKKRKMYVFGMVFFVALLFVLSTFVWTVQIEGNERIDSYTLLAYLKEEGLKPGAWKGFVDPVTLTEKCLQDFEDISWVSIRIDGTRAKVMLVETIVESPPVDRSQPSHVTAAKDGVIVSIVSGAGRPLVKQKDVVQAGDILVSGEIILMEEETEVGRQWVHAEAEVRAKVYYELTYFRPFLYTEKEYTGKETTKFSVKMFDKVVNLYQKIPYDDYDVQTTVKENSLLPFAVTEHKYIEYIPREQSYTTEEAVQAAMAVMEGKIELEFTEGRVVDQVDMSHEVQEDGVICKAFVTTIERIDQQTIIEGVELDEPGDHNQDTDGTSV